jgi:hypothetical protein
VLLITTNAKTPCKVSFLCKQIKSGEATTERQRRSRRVAAVRGAQVVAATLIGSGGELRDLLPADHRFDVVIMDEVTHGDDISRCEKSDTLAAPDKNLSNRYAIGMHVCFNSEA